MLIEIVFFILIGCLLLAGGLFLLNKLAHSSEVTFRRVFIFGGIALIAALILILLRIGLPYIAMAVAGLTASAPLLFRLLRWFYAFKAIHRLFRKTHHHKQQNSSANSGAMTRAQAAEILGVDENASKKDINENYQRLMKQVHPDKGGNSYFASQLNEARNVLLKGK